MTTGVNTPPNDPWFGALPDLGFCLDYAVLLVPNDSAPLPFVTRQVRIVSAGNVVVQFRRQSTPITIAVNAGETLNWRLKWLYATGTTATLIGFQ